MSKKRIKAKAYPVPKTRQEAEELLGTIGSLQRKVGEYESKAAARIAGIQQAFAELAAPVNEQIEGAFQAVHAWAESNRGELCEGNSKTVKLATGLLTWRFTPPAVKLTKVEAILSQLRAEGLTQFIRTTEEVNKQALLEAGEEAVAARGIRGIKFTSHEEFAAKPSETGIERVETVTTVKPTKQRRAA